MPVFDAADGTNSAPDLTKGVIVVLSGGGFDEMNPVEVRERMDDYVTKVNDDAFVQTASSGQGLTYAVLSGQTAKHLHQAQWREICEALSLLEAALILAGHSNGGAAAMNLARCLQGQGQTVKLLFTADSVLTLDDIGNVNEVPANVEFNINSYVIPTIAWILAPFPIGKANSREVDHSVNGIVNVGLKYNLPGAVAHRNAFYHMAGGDKTAAGTFSFPFTILESTIQILSGATTDDVVATLTTNLQTLSTDANVQIEIATVGVQNILHP